MIPGFSTATVKGVCLYLYLRLSLFFYLKLYFEPLQLLTRASGVLIAVWIDCNTPVPFWALETIPILPVPCGMVWQNYIVVYGMLGQKQARKLQATLVRNYDRVTYLLTYSQEQSVELLA